MPLYVPTSPRVCPLTRWVQSRTQPPTGLRMRNRRRRMKTPRTQSQAGSHLWVWGKPGVTFLCHCLIPMLCLSPAMATNGTTTFPSWTLCPEGSRQGVSQNWGTGAELGLVGCSPYRDTRCASACVCRTQRSVRTPGCRQCLPWMALQHPACCRATSRSQMLRLSHNPALTPPKQVRASQRTGLGESVLAVFRCRPSLEVPPFPPRADSGRRVLHQQ